MNAHLKDVSSNTDSLLCKPLIRGIEFCFLHAKLITKSGKEILVEKKIVLDDVISPLAQCAETETETEFVCFCQGQGGEP